MEGVFAMRGRARPETKDYERYITDLNELVKYLGERNAEMASLLASCDLSVSSQINDFVAQFPEDYVKALTLKQRQIRNTILFAEARAAENDAVMPAQFPGLLKNTDDQCDRAVQQVGRLAKMKISSEPSRRIQEPAGPGQTTQYRSIKYWRKQTKKTNGPVLAGENKWTINRQADDFLETIGKIYNTTTKNFLVQDFRVEFEGESGYDMGALTREFFYIAQEAVISKKYKDRSLLTGKRGRLHPGAINEHMVEGYQFVGRLICHAVLNNCRGLSGLSKVAQHYLIHAHGKGLAFIENHLPVIPIDEVDDRPLCELLHKMNDNDELTEADHALLKEWQQKFDYDGFKASDRTLCGLLQQILVKYVMTNRIRLLDAIAEGMDFLGLLRFLKKNPSEENLSFVFPSPADIEITPELFMGVAEIGYNDRNQRTLDFFKQFLQDLHTRAIRGKSISDLLKFMTGEPYLPPHLLLTFGYNEVMPISHACDNTLQLPVKHRDYEQFRAAMEWGMQHEAYDKK